MSSINTSPSRKCSKNNPVNRRYNISNLPDGVLSHILSRLPLKDAVRTCVLSKDWEFKWALIYDVDINFAELSLEWGEKKALVNVVERVLHHLQHVKKFSLFCICNGEYELGRIATLMSAIMRRNIKCLNLEMKENEHFVLPRSLSHCASLRKLYLNFQTLCSFKVPVKSSFPNLKMLKVFELEECKRVNVKFVEIYAPSLCKFTSNTPRKWDDKKDLDYTIKVHGAKISEFYTNGGYLENIIMIDSTVDSATLECYGSDLSRGECGLQVRKLLRGISNVRWLVIMDVLPAIGQTKLGLPLPRFLRLEKLHLLETSFDAEGLLELLYAAPFLKCLQIPSEKDEYDYDSVENLPYCVVHHLKKVIVNYKSRIPSYLIEKFLLKNGAQLKSMFINADDKLLENNIVEKLSTFPKASTCLIQ